jgi:hypothetical protein
VVTVVAAGAGQLGEAFLTKLRKNVLGLGGACFLTGEDAARQFHQADPDPHALAGWLAGIERAHDVVVCIADRSVTGWTDIALHSADQVLSVAEGEAADPNPAERLAFELFPPDRCLMISVKPHRSRVGVPSAAWLRKSKVFVSHHLAREDDEDFRPRRHPGPARAHRSIAYTLKSFMARSRSCRPISIDGSKNSIGTGRTRDAGALAKRRCRPSLTQSRLRRKK